MIMMNIMVPLSLFNRLIPDIIDPSKYHKLPLNTSVVEKNRYYMRITSENYNRLLQRGKTIQIPLSAPGIHYKQIEKYGHDRVLELAFLNMIPTPNGDIQLTFETMKNNVAREIGLYVACRSGGIKEYSFDMFVKMNREDIRRDHMRMRLVKWRKSVFETERRIREEEIREGNLSQSHGDYLRMRVRRLIATTREEHIERMREITFLD